MNKLKANILVYITNTTILFTHQADAVYWKEWELFFNQKDGLSGFLIFNIVALLLASYGLVFLAQDKRSGYLFSLFLGITGIITFTIHNYYFVAGYQQFKVPFSIALIYLTLPVSLLQVYLSIASLNKQNH